MGKNSDIQSASIQLNDANRYMAMANGADGSMKDVWLGEAIAGMKRTAAALGFDLVPRVDEKALEMHFSDGALPVTDKPGFDGRDNSSIDDNVWSPLT